MACLRSLGIRCIIYLDDLLLFCDKVSRLRSQTKFVVDFESLGFVVNHNKSGLEPSQVVQFLSFKTDSTTCMLQLPLKKIAAMRKEIRKVLSMDHTTLRLLARVVGPGSPTLQGSISSVLTIIRSDNTTNNPSSDGTPMVVLCNGINKIYVLK
ncbi:Hypothetical predicted protein [Pelobates cultripes]|uniref:Reverse transcriptase domain-containing protein n=1 Tax=Pelobates cultripes TaxID=61616 RepID=A0AAD1RGV9_PELCU|nr:Hypothetical predicted protein [Pelobates cultripes]